MGLWATHCDCQHERLDSGHLASQTLARGHASDSFPLNLTRGGPKGACVELQSFLHSEEVDRKPVPWGLRHDRKGHGRW